MLRDVVEVCRVERVSPTFVRVELGGPCLADFGVDGPTYDQRIKLVFAPASGVLPDLGSGGESWYATWLALPEEERGSMRTYTVREVRGTGAGTRLVVDFAVHGDPTDGPGSAWAASAEVGTQVVLVAPRRGEEFGGIEFDPGEAPELLLVGDETAVPAVAAILSQLGPDARGVAFLEVPDPADVQLLSAPDGVDVRWLVRDGRAWGTRVVPAVRRHVGLPEAAGDPARDVEPLPADADEVWETPHGSRGPADGCYAWIAGESRVVRTLRRALVSERGWERSRVAFMGYWREGVAMRS